jgi:hypothetical protein
VAVHERIEGRACLVVVIVPREPVQAEPRHGGAAGPRQEGAQGVLAHDSPHSSCIGQAWLSLEVGLPTVNRLFAPTQPGPPVANGCHVRPGVACAPRTLRPVQ